MNGFNDVCENIIFEKSNYKARRILWYKMAYHGQIYIL